MSSSRAPRGEVAAGGRVGGAAIQSRRLAMAALAGALAIGLAACSGLSPVYETPRLSGDTPALSFASPNNRTEQLIYQDLALRFARGDASAPRLTVATSTATRNLTGNRVTSAQVQQQVTVTAQISLTDATGAVLFTGTRAASADMTTDAQVLSGRAASDDAAARAAHALADMIRLTVLGALAR